MIVLVTHALTSWAVTERVLLRDEYVPLRRVDGDQRFWGDGLTSQPTTSPVWTFTQHEGDLGQHVDPATGYSDCLLHPVLCFVSHPPTEMALPKYELIPPSLGWFPILFFTSIWVSEIYKSSYSGPETDVSIIEADGVRAGARALLFQALVNITCSVGLPTLISESGVQSGLSGGSYESINGNGATSRAAEDDDRWKPMSMVQDVRSGRIVPKIIGWVGGLVNSVRDGSAWNLPIINFTLIKLWYISQFTFAIAMGMTW